jgi:hypothetical protein
MTVWRLTGEPDGILSVPRSDCSYDHYMVHNGFEQQLLHARYDADQRARDEAAGKEAADRQERQAREDLAALILRVGGRAR